MVLIPFLVPKGTMMSVSVAGTVSSTVSTLLFFPYFSLFLLGYKSVFLLPHDVWGYLLEVWGNLLGLVYFQNFSRNGHCSTFVFI